ncbi:response regulator [Roseomonas sp. M0104]|uniref:Response regulator n=1 Tax=Teichococcus coralli TaxID=2545983 RepID=A0A845BEV3_9PROT|nr:response regulator [Pseudoroseomonas coralli]
MIAARIEAAFVRKAGLGAAEVMITDVTMPGLDGLALIRAARARHSGRPVLLITGQRVMRHRCSSARPSRTARSGWSTSRSCRTSWQIGSMP